MPTYNAESCTSLKDKFTLLEANRGCATVLHPIYRFAETMILHRGSAAKFLLDEKVTGMTPAALKDLERMSSRDLINNLLLPAVLSNRDSINVSRIPELANIWASNNNKLDDRAVQIRRNNLLAHLAKNQPIFIESQKLNPAEREEAVSLDDLNTYLIEQIFPTEELFNRLSNLTEWYVSKNTDFNMTAARRTVSAIHSQLLKASLKSKIEIDNTEELARKTKTVLPFLGLPESVIPLGLKFKISEIVHMLTSKHIAIDPTAAWYGLGSKSSRDRAISEISGIMKFPNTVESRAISRLIKVMPTDIYHAWIWDGFAKAVYGLEKPPNHLAKVLAGRLEKVGPTDSRGINRDSFASICTALDRILSHPRNETIRTELIGGEERAYGILNKVLDMQLGFDTIIFENGMASMQFLNLVKLLINLVPSHVEDKELKDKIMQLYERIYIYRPKVIK